MNEKQLAGEKAAEFVKDGMIVGLGTGSTVFYTLQELGRRVKNGLSIKGVTTSTSTTKIAQELGIPLVSLNEVESIDLTIDGTDEVDHDGHGIKGGGGALLFEKLVAAASKEIIWVADSSKIVNKLGAFPLPVEVIPFGYEQVKRQLESKGIHVVLREKDGTVYTTDSGNYILDVHLHAIDDAITLERELNQIVGVVENGLFIGMANRTIVGKEGNINIIEYR